MAVSVKIPVSMQITTIYFNGGGVGGGKEQFWVCLSAQARYIVVIFCVYVMDIYEYNVKDRPITRV
jgi:hypothetical protein